MFIICDISREKGGQRKFKPQQLPVFPNEYQAYSKFSKTLIKMPKYEFYIFITTC